MKLNLKYQLKLDQVIVGNNTLVDNGIAFGIDEFGKSAPYKDIYKYFGLESTKIKNKCKKLLKNKMTIKIGINGMGTDWSYGC